MVLIMLCHGPNMNELVFPFENLPKSNLRQIRIYTNPNYPKLFSENFAKFCRFSNFFRHKRGKMRVGSSQLCRKLARKLSLRAISSFSKIFHARKIFKFWNFFQSQNVILYVPRMFLSDVGWYTAANICSVYITCVHTKLVKPLCIHVCGRTNVECGRSRMKSIFSWCYIFVL